MRVQTGTERAAKTVQHASADSERRKYAKQLNLKKSTWNTKAINIFNKFGIPSKLFGARFNKEGNVEFYAG